MQPTRRDDFGSQFRALTGERPLRWQQRIFDKHFVLNDVPEVIDLPTGLGKTMVMAVWLIARANKLDVPTRLIYVVDRRTVVDQATDLAEKLVKNWEDNNLFDADPPAISTLRGQRADNREWLRDPALPAIIIGTVDLIGSALLFSGYRSSFKRRPLEAGLLGQDSLLVLDEAHLSKPFEELLGSIASFQKTRSNEGSPVKPMRVLRMSATGTNAKEDGAFQLDTAPGSETFDLWSERDESGQEKNPTKTRFDAKKRLTITPLGEKDGLNKKLADAAIKLAQEPDLVGKRIVVFVRKPDDAKAVAEAIRGHKVDSIGESGPKPKKIKDTPYLKSVEILTGTIRGLERDELVEKAVFKERWLNGHLKPDDPANQSPVFLISTSAGEVGFDLNADHMVCDATTIDSLIQRLGRVNRRGLGDAQVHLIVESPKKDGKPKKLEGLDLAIANTIDLLRDVTDVSPKNIAALKGSNDWKVEYAAACSPKPPTVELTDVLLDAWSMTSITEPMPGRPEVGPWLRGIDDEQAQTTVAWRAELELFHYDPSPEKALRAVFVKHPIRPHESLTINTKQLLKFLERIAKLKDRPPDLMSTRVAVRLPRGHVVCRTLQQLTDESGILFADSTLILPARFGGLGDFGMLDADAIPKTRSDGDPEPPSRDVADQPDYEQTDAVRSRLRILIKRSEDGSWTPEPVPGGFPISESLKLESDYEKSTSLFNDLKAAGLRVRLVQPVRFDGEGDPVRSLVILAPAPDTKNKEDQLLTDHVGAVEAEARRIADALRLAKDDPIRVALLFAAKWHDEGKRARIWQLFANNPDPDGRPLGKMAQSRDPKSLRGYRHEFGSLLRIQHPDRCGTSGCDLPVNSEARELALHLIATHHGAGRPHFGHAPYDPFTDAERDAIHADSLRRFARLQRKYGWWHLAWLENLLRCADALASADQDAVDDPADTEGGTP